MELLGSMWMMERVPSAFVIVCSMFCVYCGGREYRNTDYKLGGLSRIRKEKKPLANCLIVYK